MYLPVETNVASQRHQKRQTPFAEALWQNDHVLSIQTLSRPAIALEHLTHIRKTSRKGRGKGNKHVDIKRPLHRWSFAPLYSFSEYNVEAREIAVVKVDPVTRTL